MTKSKKSDEPPDTFRWSDYLYEVDRPIESKDGNELILAQCPECGVTDNRVSVRLDWGTFHCYRCGNWFRPARIVRMYENLSGAALRDRLQQFRSSPASRFDTLEEAIAALDAEMRPTGQKKVVLEAVEPPPVCDLTPDAERYLDERGVDSHVRLFFGLKTCEGGRMGGRVYIPVISSGVLLGFQARAIYGETPKYLTPKNNRLRQTLYNIDNVREGWLAVVEGPFDVWAVWSYATQNVVGSFGKTFTKEQLTLLTQHRGGIYLMLDPDAFGEALKQAAILWSFGKRHIKIAMLPKDDPSADPQAIAPALDNAPIYAPERHLSLAVKYLKR